MKVTLIGHATLLVEHEGGATLMDPVFGDPFEEGVVCTCPAREVFPDKLPKLDRVILSHAHPDHFDVPTLATLPRDVEVICPQDPLLTYALNALGFRDVRPTEASATLERGPLQILTTHSATDVIEFGVVFKDSSGVFWNQVDTSLKPGTIEYTRLQVGRVDLLFAMYASQNFGFFGSMRSGYPLDTTKSNLDNVKQIAPGLVVPGSAGFRFAGPFAWTNPFLFPVSRARFLGDLARVAPEIPTALANPGDAFEIAASKVTRHAAASPFARMIEDDTHLVDFDAGAPVPPLADPNLDQRSHESLTKHVRACFDHLGAFVRAGYGAAPDRLITEHRKLGSIYVLDVLFPDDTRRWLRVEFAPDAPKIAEGEGAFRGSTHVLHIAASALTAWMRNEKSYYWYRGFLRRSETVPASLVNGKVVIDAREFPDLLEYFMNRKAPGAADARKKHVDRLLAPFVSKSPS